MYDQPTMAELVGAARDFIQNHAMPKLEGHAAFHARVTANALGIVQRQLELGEAHEREDEARVRELVGEDGTLEELNRTLCQAIREGKVTMDTPGLMDHLWKSTLDKVAVDQPKYSGYKRALEERE